MVEQGQNIRSVNPTLFEAMKKEIKDKLFTFGYDWNKTAMAKKYNTTTHTIYSLIEELQSEGKHVDYHLMQIMRLEKQRQLILEEVNHLRSKNKSRVQALRELRETERDIANLRLKAGLMENNEIIHIESKNENKSEITIGEVGRILEKEIQDIQQGKEDGPEG